MDPVTTAQETSSVLIQYGAIGAMLIIVVASGLYGLRAVWNTSVKAMEKKDAVIAEKDLEIKRVNEARVEGALSAVEAIRTLTQKLEGLHEVVEAHIQEIRFQRGGQT